MKRMVMRKVGPTRQTNSVSSGYDATLAISYGIVQSNNTNGTCLVKLITGFDVTVRIPSSFPPSKEPTTGGIHYPTVGAYVAIIHPKGDLNSGFIMPAPFDIRDQNVIDDLLSDGDKTITDDGWTISRDRETGEIVVENGDKFSLTIDPDSETTELNDFHDNNILMDSDGIKLNGTGYTLTKYSPMDSAIQGLVSDIQIELGKIATAITGLGGSYTPGTLSIDLSGAEADTLITG